MPQKLSTGSKVDTRVAPSKQTGFRSISNNAVVALALLVLSFACFGSSLDSYFIASDDAWHLPLLHKALTENIFLLLQQFGTPSTFHNSFFVMYRPITELSLALDYAVWGANAYGYHLTNIVLHALNAFMVFICGRKLLEQLVAKTQFEEERRVLDLVALATAVLFVSYPANAEVVCWISDRCDTLGTFLYLSTLTTYLSFRKTGKRLCYYLSLVLASLAMFSKEACSTIPAIILLIELFIWRKDARSEQTGGKVFSLTEFARSARLVVPFFGVFLLYFTCRWLAIGDPLVGYVGTVGHIAKQSLVDRLFSIAPFWRLIHPLNSHIFGRESQLDLILRIFFAGLAVTILAGGVLCQCTKERARLAILLIFMGLVMIAPTVSVWSISEGLLGARFAYLGLFPFILGFVLFLTPFGQGRAARVLRTAVLFLLIGLVSLYTMVSEGNSSAWVNAAEDVRKIRQQVEDRVARMPADKKLVVLNLPYNRSGVAVFFSTEFLAGILKPPLTGSDISNRVIGLDGAPMNNRYVNRSQLLRLAETPNRYEFVIWNKEKHTFKQVRFPDVADSNEMRRALPVVSLGSYKKPNRAAAPRRSSFGNRITGNDIDSYLISARKKVNPFEANTLVVNITTRCLQVQAPNAVEHMVGQLAEFKESISSDQDPKENNQPKAALSWSSQSLDESDEDALEPIEFPLYDDGVPRTYEIDLSPYKEWLVSSGISAFRLDLPKDNNPGGKGRKTFAHQVRTAYISNQHKRIPELECISAFDTMTTGLQRARAFPIRFQYNAAMIDGATGAIAEISQPFCEFFIYSGHYRARKPSRHAMKTISLKANQGSFELNGSDFPKHANYQIRVLATDNKGGVIGQSSDPTTFTMIADP